MKRHSIGAGALSALRTATAATTLGWTLTAGMALAAPVPIGLDEAFLPTASDADRPAPAWVADVPGAPTDRVRVAGGFGIRLGIGGLHFGGVPGYSLPYPAYGRGSPGYQPGYVYEEQPVVESPPPRARISKPKRRKVASPKKSTGAKTAAKPTHRVTRAVEAAPAPVEAGAPFLSFAPPLAPAGEGPVTRGDSTGGGRPTFRIRPAGGGSGALGENTGGGRLTPFRLAPRRAQP